MDFGVPELPVRPTVERGIAYWFRLTTVPVGGAPLDIRRRWIGVPLPVSSKYNCTLSRVTA